MKLLAQALVLPDPTGKNYTVSVPGLNPKFMTLGGVLSQAVYFVFAFAGIGLLIMLIMGGFSFLTSAGDAKKLEQGKQQITNALIGFLIIFSAFWIVQIAGTMFGIKAITGTGGVFQ